GSVWEQHRGRLTGPDLQNCVLRDLFRAVDLAPHLPASVADLVGVLVNVPPSALSRAERENLLRRAEAGLGGCRELAGHSAELDHCRLLLLEQLDPEAARAEVERLLLEARRAGEVAGEPRGE